MNNYNYQFEAPYNKRISRTLNQFWIGFVIYTSCYALMISGVVSSKITYLQLLGVLLFLSASFFLIRFRIENKYLRSLFIIYIAWLAYVVMRGFKFNSKFLFETFTDGTGGIFLYLLPLIIFFPKNLIYLKKTMNVIFILSIFYILFSIAFIKPILLADSENGQTILEYFSKILGIPCGFILLTVIYNTNKRKFLGTSGKLWCLFVIALTALLAVVQARRGLMFMAVSILVAAYIMYNYAHKSNLFFRFFPLFIVFFLSIYAITALTSKKSGAINRFADRVFENSRGDVVDYFYLDMTKKDWLIGRGINGLYYCPTGATEDGYRNVIETDYLQIILKGGIISLALLLLIAIPAIIKGLFYSKNILSKAAAIWILLWLLALFPATVTTFSLNYLLVWISIGICYSKEMRNMPEDLVKENFQYQLFNPNVYTPK